jgi:hypothetical protein
VAKKEQPINDAVQTSESVAALEAKVDKLLTIAAEQQEENDALKARVEAMSKTGAASVAVAKVDEQAKLEAELAALAEEFKDIPNVDVLRSRVLHGVDANQDIRLLDEPTIGVDPTGATRKWQLRWFNLEKEGRSEQAKAEGYVKVQWDELQDKEAIATGTRTDVFVRKGMRGLEVLYKIPRRFYQLKKRADALRRAGKLTSESAMRSDIANKTAALAGREGGNADQAGSFVDRSMTMTITPGETERVTF